MIKNKDKPLKEFNANFQTDQVVYSSGSVQVRPCLSGYLFFGAFLFLGLAVPLIVCSSPAEKTDGKIICMTVGFFMFCGGLGALIWYIRHNRSELDLIGRRFYPEGRKNNAFGIPFSEIEAIQLMPAGKGYELNFICSAKRRVNFLAHGGKGAMIRDAEKLSEILNIPVVDAERKVISPKDFDPFKMEKILWIIAVIIIFLSLTMILN